MISLSLLRVHQNQKLNCDICTKVYFTITDLKEHKRSEHGNPRTEDEEDGEDQDGEERAEKRVEFGNSVEPLIITNTGIVQNISR